jgi:hypothetical protein
VIASWELPAAIFSGAVAGGGLYLFARELLPATPALGPALGRLQPQADSATPSERMAESLGGWGWVVRFLTIPTKDLAILGMGADAYVSSIVLSAATGYFLPAIVVIILRIAGYDISLLLPFGAGIATGALAAYIAHRDVAKKARRARAEFSRAFCTYLDLVVLELAAAGPVQSLERAARICHGWVYDRINNALLQAQLEMSFPWDHLRKLGQQIQVTELHDLAAIMQSAGNEGAQVQGTLQQQAESLRDRLRTDQLARAEQISAALEMPAALLVIVLAFFMIYPLMARI